MSSAARNADIHDFVKRMVAFRGAHPLLSRESFYTSAEVSWFTPAATVPDWSDAGASTLGCLMRDAAGPDALYLMFNATDKPTLFLIHPLPTGNVVWVTPDTPLADVAEAMEAHQVKRLPVMEDGRLIGIVSRADLLRALVQLLGEREVPTISDVEIRERVLAEIEKQKWAPRTTVDVTVRGGIVDLRGAVTDDRERARLRVIAENTPGVRSVYDRLVWIEPLSGTVIDPNE
jgi:hypothetical protein